MLECFKQVPRRRGLASALRVAAIVVAGVAATTAPARAQAPGTLLVNEGFDQPLWPNSLIANEYVRYNPGDPAAPVSPTWRMTSGSLF